MNVTEIKTLLKKKRKECLKDLKEENSYGYYKEKLDGLDEAIQIIGMLGSKHNHITNENKNTV